MPSFSCTGAEQERRLKDADLHYRLGDGAFRDRNIPEAIKELHRSIELDPTNADALHLLGFVYLGRQDYDRALEYFKRAIKQRPGFLEARNNLGTCYLALCRWSEAAEIFQRLEDEPLYPTPYIAHNNLGLALLNQGRAEEAVQRFRRAVFLNASFCVGYNNLGRTLLELGRVEEAQQALTRALSVDPLCTRTFAEPRLHLGRLYEQLGDRAQALAEYRKCQELTKDSLDLGAGCGQVPVSTRCNQKVRQLEVVSQ